MRTGALVRRIGQQMMRDKRTLALMMVAPLLILTLIHFLFTSDSGAIPKLAVIGADEAIAEALRDKEIEPMVYPGGTEAKKLLAEEELDGVLQWQGEEAALTLRNEDPASAKALQMKVMQTLAAQAAKQQDRKSVV